MKKALIALLSFVLIFPLFNCGGKEGGNEKPEAAVEELSNGKDAADAIMTEYDALISEASDLLKQENDIAKLKTKIQELKTKYIDIFVEIGRQREAMGETEINNCNTELLTAFSKIDGTKMKFFFDKTNEYSAIDAELGSLLRDLNILTQYSQFELLKKQLPKEAERLGVK